MEEIEIIKEFVIESSENLDRLDREMVELEQTPQDARLLASIFRTIHTIKGTCGFLGFSTLECITHHAENILSQVRNGERSLTPDLVSLILSTADAVKGELISIETSGAESGEAYEHLIARQEAALKQFQPPQDAEAALEPKPIAPEPAMEQAIETGPAAVPTDSDPHSDRPEIDCNQRNSSVADSTIRVDVGLLNKLMNLVGELVLARNQILQFSNQSEDASLAATSQRLNLITSELQEGVMKTRMQPIGMIWKTLPRVVRDLAAACGKQIQLEMNGATTELDKTIIEAIKDPLTHIVRNSCDHGVETAEARLLANKTSYGTLSLRAFHEGGNVNIEISDDGAGIDSGKIRNLAIEKGLLRKEQAERMHERELVNLVFLPGFSTAQKVSSISGRGVGMDVVKTNIEKIGGSVDLSSESGKGTTVRIKIPLTLAIIPGLVVMSGGERFIIPQVSLLELVRLEGVAAHRQVEHINGAPVYRRRGNLLPLAHLNQVLGLQTSGALPEVINIIILQAEDRQFGLIVDAINDTQEIVVKPLGNQLKGLKGYAGATIMGDGKVSLILDVLGIAQLSRVLSNNIVNSSKAEESVCSEGDKNDRQTLLLFRAGDSQRLAVPLSIVARLEEIAPHQIEYAAGGMAVQYRGEILPLVSLASHLGCASSQPVPDGPLSVIVFGDSRRTIGLLVEQFIDIVEEVITIKKPSNRPGLLGSAVVGGKVTDFLDLQSVIAGFERNWFQDSASMNPKRTVLISDASSFSRSLMRNCFEMEGHKVIETATAPEAIERLSKYNIDLVFTALELPDRGAYELLRSVQGDGKRSSIPVIAFSANARAAQRAETLEAAFSECLFECDRASMLQSLERFSRIHAQSACASATKERNSFS